MATSFPRTEDCMLILISSHIYLEFLESTSTLLQHADGHQTTPELNYKDSAEENGPLSPSGLSMMIWLLGNPLATTRVMR